MHRLYQLKKVQKLLLATNNSGKFRELKEILPKYHISKGKITFNEITSNKIFRTRWDQS